MTIGECQNCFRYGLHIAARGRCARCYSRLRAARYRRAINRLAIDHGLPPIHHKEHEGESQLHRILCISTGLHWEQNVTATMPGHELDMVQAEHRIIVEHDGTTHRRPVARMGGPKAHRRVKKRDAHKEQWAEDNGWRLIRFNGRQQAPVEMYEALLQEIALPYDLEPVLVAIGGIMVDD